MIDMQPRYTNYLVTVYEYYQVFSGDSNCKQPQKVFRFSLHSQCLFIETAISLVSTSLSINSFKTKTIKSCCYQMLALFRKCVRFWKAPRVRPIVLLVRLTCR